MINDNDDSHYLRLEEYLKNPRYRTLFRLAMISPVFLIQICLDEKCIQLLKLSKLLPTRSKMYPKDILNCISNQEWAIILLKYKYYDLGIWTQSLENSFAKRFFHSRRKEIEFFFRRYLSQKYKRLSKTDIFRLFHEDKKVLKYENIDIRLRFAIEKNNLKEKVLKELKYRGKVARVKIDRDAFIHDGYCRTKESILQYILNHSILSFSDLYKQNLYLYNILSHNRPFANSTLKHLEAHSMFDRDKIGVQKQIIESTRSIADDLLRSISKSQYHSCPNLRKFNRQIGQYLSRYKKYEFVKFYIDINLAGSFKNLSTVKQNKVLQWPVAKAAQFFIDLDIRPKRDEYFLTEKPNAFYREVVRKYEKNDNPISS